MFEQIFFFFFGGGRLSSFFRQKVASKGIHKMKSRERKLQPLILSLSFYFWKDDKSSKWTTQEFLFSFTSGLLGELLLSSNPSVASKTCSSVRLYKFHFFRLANCTQQNVRVHLRRETEKHKLIGKLGAPWHPKKKKRKLIQILMFFYTFCGFFTNVKTEIVTLFLFAFLDHGFGSEVMKCGE